MMSSKFSKQVRLVLSAIVIVCFVHLMIGFLWTPTPRRHFRLRPRHASEVEVRGRTYHVHMTSPVDTKHMDLVKQRIDRNDAARPHFIARREILSETLGTDPSDYQSIDREETTIKVTCNTCSLVGFSGHLLGTKAGRLIDESDCVFRLGKAPTTGFETNVGRRTTFRVLHASTLYALLHRTNRLWTGPLAAENVVVFGTPAAKSRRQTGDSFAGIRQRLRGLPENVTVLFVSRKGERNASKFMLESGEALGYHLIGVHPSTLWFAVKLTSDVGCNQLRVFGIPDSRFCKRNPNSPMKSHYWEHFSNNQCNSGEDPGYTLDPLSPDAHELTLADRRALAGWSTTNSVTFSAPPWPRGSKLR